MTSGGRTGAGAPAAAATTSLLRAAFVQPIDLKHTPKASASGKNHAARTDLASSAKEKRMRKEEKQEAMKKPAVLSGE